jgi:site-specific DNA-methyltransferase (adenine-specific)
MKKANSERRQLGPIFQATRSVFSTNGYRPKVELFLGDALSHYPRWPTPVVIVSDGAYGVSGFPGDTPTAEGLADWYEPHVEAWSRYATPKTTLWFWNTELGWATVHPVLMRHGWEYRNCHIWDKGLGHIAGNANSKTLRKFPVVTEVCAQYVKAARFTADQRQMSMKEWLRYEWLRSGLPLTLTNEACGVKNAATRKYFTQCHLWYYPPPEAFEQFVRYANTHGDKRGRPYFSVDGVCPLTATEWAEMRAKFYCEISVTNVWSEPAMHGVERMKDEEQRCIHGNQKPLRLIDLILRASSDPGDVVWEPFGGLCSVAISALRHRRSCYSAELIPEFFRLARRRLKEQLARDSTGARKHAALA